MSAPQPAEATSGRAPRVLVVEDDPALRLVAKTALAAAGFAVESAENGDVALRLARPDVPHGTTAPDVIVLDSQMPVLDGLGFARAYHAHHRATGTPPAPIVAASGRADALLFAALVGAAAVLPKPYSTAELVATVRRVTAG